jgi:hypothetical protein
MAWHDRPCKEWTGRRNHIGYGVLDSRAGGKRTTIRVHRKVLAEKLGRHGPGGANRRERRFQSG